MAWNKGLTIFWLLVSVAVTVGLTALLWFVFRVPVFIGFLFLPFLFSGLRWFGGRSKRRQEQEAPWAEGGRPARGVCPVCGWRAQDPRDRYCPRDGSELT